MLILPHCWSDVVLVTFTVYLFSRLHRNKLWVHFFVSLGDLSKIEVNDFCWCILYFAGADFEVKSAPTKYMHQQNSAGVHQKIPTLKS
jgi:hypothetical protein